MIGCSITVLVLDVIAMPRSGARCLRQNQVNINIIYYQYYSFTVERQAAKTGACSTWKVALKYKVEQSKTVNLLPTIRLAQSVLKRKFPSVDKPLRI